MYAHGYSTFFLFQDGPVFMKSLEGKKNLNVFKSDMK